tara:strand:- start:216 stop:695 length:480 start_codon:yes stop_codon:yes gene_type:complete
MVYNKKGGKHKHKARKDHKPKSLNIEQLKKIDGQEYAFVKEKFSSQHYKLLCYDKVERLGCLRGKLRKARIKNADLVLVSIREFQDDKCDIIYHYKEEDIDKLLRVKAVDSSFIKEGKLNIEEDNQDDSSDDEDIQVNDTSKEVSINDLEAAGINFDDI